MDPNANLKEQREIARRIIAAVDAADDDTGEWVCNPDDAYRLSELVQSLDGWMGRSGYLPSAWEWGR